MSEPIRILIVEDLPPDADLAMREIRKSLGECVFQRVETEHDYLEALDKFNPDLILSDYHLPNFDGVQALKLALKRVPFTPVIIFTGSLSEDIAVDCVKAGASNYVIKENIKRLGTAVSHALKEKKVYLERKQAEEELRYSEEKFRNLFNNSEVGMFRTRLDGSEILEFNEKFLKILGYTFDEVKGKASVDMWADKLERNRMVELLRAEGRVTDLECGILNKQGEVRRCITSLRLYRDTGILEGSIQDITERKRAEEALQESERKLKQAQQIAKVGYWENDLIADRITGSEEAHRIFGLQSPVANLSSAQFQEMIHPDDRQLQRQVWSNALQGSRDYKVEYRIVRPDGDIRFVHARDEIVYDESGKPIRVFGVIQDITERKQAEEELLRSKAELQEAQRIGKIGSWDWDAIADKINWSEEYYHVYGFDPSQRPPGYEEHLKAYSAESAARLDEAVKKSMETGEPYTLELERVLADGTTQWIIARGEVKRDSNGEIVGLCGTAQDITERKRAEERLRLSEEQYRNLFNHLPIPVFTKDINGIYTSSNKENLKYWATNPIGHTDAGLLPNETAEALRAIDQSVIKSGEAVSSEELLPNTPMGNRQCISIKAPLRDVRGNIIGILGASLDITDHKRAEEKLAASEAELRTLFSAMMDVVTVLDADGRYVEIAPTNPANLYRTPEGLLGHTMHEILPKDTADIILSKIHETLQSGQPVNCEYALQIGDKEIWFFANISRLSENTAILVARDISERKQAEQAISQHVAELEMLYDSGLALGQLLSVKMIAQKVVDVMNAQLDWHHIAIRLYHPENESLELLAFYLPDTMSTGERRLSEERFKSLNVKTGDGLSGWAVEHRQVVRIDDLSHDRRYLETFSGMCSGLYVPLKVEDRVVGVISIESEKRDAFSETDERLTTTLANQAAIALENARLHQETLQHLKQLQALHIIDRTIAGSFDQGMMLDVLLTQTLSQLEAEAAAIFLIQPHQRGALQYVAGQGFNTGLIQIASLKLGNSLAGEAVTGRKLIHVCELEQREPDPLLSKLWLGEGFKCMDVIPLISKGEVKGVMTVFHRKDFTPEPAWSSFLETLAGQAAIAIDVTQMFDNLQRANMELAVAYEATIEGWSQAMDLRDKETEGHTQRVTQMSQRLGKAMQLGEEYLLHMRRGALLHDIGKLGVPDAILLKPDKLTDEEWLVMKKHPEFAYDMLHSVAYLRNSMDIPYCHHEKWDGSGYPQGLKGEQIPLAARIFAIVDVWDALTSDRPYRKAWSKPDAMKYIREQSGKHFDPLVVEIFLKEFGDESA